MFFTKKQLGFTLVEMMVVIGVMGILFTIAIPAEVNYRKRMEVKSAAKEIRSLFWDAQTRSLAPRPVGRTAANNYAGVYAYEVGITKQASPPSSYTYRVKECASPSTCSNFDGSYKFTWNEGRIYIADIIPSSCVVAPTSNLLSLAVYFAVSNDENAGVMSFYKTVNGEAIDCDKIEIIIASTAYSGFEYKVTLDKGNNSIDYALNP